MQTDDPTLKAIEEIVNNDFSLEFDLVNPETQLQEVIGLLEVATRCLTRVSIKYQTARSQRKFKEAATRRALHANNIGPKLTEQMLSDALAVDPVLSGLLNTEIAYETAGENIKKYMELYNSYRETLFRLVTLKSAETRNIR